MSKPNSYRFQCDFCDNEWIADKKDFKMSTDTFGTHIKNTYVSYEAVCPRCKRSITMVTLQSSDESLNNLFN